MRKNNCKIVLSLLTALIATLVISTCCMAKDDGEDIWLEDRPPMERPFKLNDEMIEGMLARLSESDPNKAKELEQLRKDNREKFQSELKKIMREQFSGKNREQQGNREGGRGGFEPQDRPNAGPNNPACSLQEPPFMHKGDEWMAKTVEEFTIWLEKNYPDEATKLIKLKEENPKLYMKQLAINMKKYKRIQEVSKENPELAEVLKQNLELNKKRDQLLKDIRTAKNDKDKKVFTAELEKLLNNKFDLIVKRKQMEYDALRKRLETLKSEIEANLEKWKSAEFKKNSVKAQLEELLNKQDKFEWD